MNTIRVKELISFGWAIFKKEPWKLVGVFALALAVSMTSSYLFGAEGAGFVLWLVDYVVQLVISLGMVAIVLKAHDAVEHIALTDAWRPEKLITYAIVTILAGIITLIGFVLLIVPGVIATISFMFAPYIVLSTNKGPIEALKESYALAKGKRWPLFLFLLAAVGLNIIGALLVGVGLLVTIPVTMIAIAHAYKTLSGGVISAETASV